MYFLRALPVHLVLAVHAQRSLIPHRRYFQHSRRDEGPGALASTGCHDARHTRLTQLAGSGIDPKTLSRFAGHSSVAFTLQVYVTPSRELAAAAVNQADKVIYQAK